MRYKVNRIFYKFLNLENCVLNLLLFLLIFLLTFLKRTYFLVTSPLYIDPWVGLGYGRTFPERAFQFHYYKESRIVHSALTHLFFLDTSLTTQIIFGSGIVAATAIIIIAAIQLSGMSKIISILLGVIVSLSPWIWGDSAGGFDYYNTFGNLYIALSLYLLSHYYFRRKNSLNLFISGFLISLIIIEVPSGILYTAWLALVFALGNLNRTKTISLIKGVALDVLKVFFGMLTFFAFEVITLRFFDENPNRILTGLKTLVDIVLQKESTQGYWIQLDFSDFFNRPGVAFFTSLFLGLLVLFAYNLKNSNYKSGSNSLVIQNFTVSALVLSFLVLILQLLGKTIALTTSYFTIPILLFLIFSAGLNLELTVKSNSSSFYIAFASVFFVWTSIHFILLFFGVFTLVFVVYLFNQNSHFKLALTLLVVMNLILNSGTQIPSSSERLVVKRCEESRFEWRQNSLKIMNFLDTFSSRRGELVMGFEPSIFDKPIKNSNCSMLLNYEYSYLLATLSYQGILGANTFGPLPYNSSLLTQYGFIAETFLSPRERKLYTKERCTLVWSSKLSTTRDLIIELSVNETKFYGFLYCEVSPQISKVLSLNFRI